MSYPTVEELVTRYGYSRAHAEREVKRANCSPHEYAPYRDPQTGKTGTLCMWTPFGCSRTCVKCGATTVDPNHCGQSGRATPSGSKGGDK